MIESDDSITVGMPKRDEQLAINHVATKYDEYMIDN